MEKTSVLQSELQSCTQLLELEPQNKCESLMCLILHFNNFYFHAALFVFVSHFLPPSGCLLTIILLMRALDPLGHEKETLAHFQMLKV